ncbi:hypothetical protein LSH36_568g02030, partial [Paralvinella palmiformis]
MEMAGHTYVDVVNYLLFSQSTYTKEELTKYKSLERYKLFQGEMLLETCICFVQR